MDDFAPRLAFFFACHTDLFEEVAKFRAARRLYARIMKERFGANNPKSMMLRFHTQTGGVTLTAQQPDNNVVRVAIQTLAAVMGGTQSLHTNSKDEALALPTRDSVLIALRTQQIMAHESGVTNTIDPFGGSYFVEQLTDKLEAEAEQYIKTIDDMGGMVTAIEQGYVQKQIEESAYQYGRSVEDGERIVVGVNEYQMEQEPEIETFSVPEETARKQIENLKRTKAGRNQNKVKKALAAIEAAARSDDNLMPHIIDAVRVNTSTGEICQSLQQVFGEYTESFN